jgi:hypothetical protein
MPRGGHFASETDPDLVADDLRRFFVGLQAPQDAPHERNDH